MPVSISTLLSGNSTTPAASYNTISISPSANTLIILTVNSETTATVTPNIPTVTGNGLTWVNIGSYNYDDTSSTRRTVSFFRAMGSSPSAGALTISFGGQTQGGGATWVADQFSNVDTSGTNGSGAIIQAVVGATSDSGNDTSLTITLSSFSSVNNPTYGSFGLADPNQVAGTGFTLQTVNNSNIVLTDATEFDNANNTSVGMSFNATFGAGIGIEIKAAASTTQYYSSLTMTGAM